MPPAQGQPSRGASQPSAGHAPMSRGGGTATAYRAPQIPSPPGRAGRKPTRKRDVILAAVAVLFVIGVIANALGVGKHANTAVNGAASPNARARAEAVCERRGLASGDVYVRKLSPGTQWVAQQLGGEWVWNASLGKCLTSVQMAIATAPLSAGNCTQVGYKGNNPGYDPNATVAAPLMRIVAQAGPACLAAA